MCSHPMVQAAHYRIWDGDCVLLCTDGLTSQVDDDRIAEVLSLRRQPDEHCQMLLDLALERGGPDNITTLVLEVNAP